MANSGAGLFILLNAKQLLAWGVRDGGTTGAVVQFCLRLTPSSDFGHWSQLGPQAQPRGPLSSREHTYPYPESKLVRDLALGDWNPTCIRPFSSQVQICTADLADASCWPEGRHSLCPSLLRLSLTHSGGSGSLQCAHSPGRLHCTLLPGSSFQHGRSVKSGAQQPGHCGSLFRLVCLLGCFFLSAAVCCVGESW